jgi:hypothetical protein
MANIRSQFLRNPRGGSQLWNDGPAGEILRAEFFGVEAGGSAADLVIQNGAHAHTATTAALVSTSALAIAAAQHGHIATSPALSATYPLTIYPLTIGNAAHSHAATAPAITSLSVLAPAGAQHAHAADAPALSSAPGLSAANAAHGHTAGSLTLVAINTYPLTIQNAIHGGTVPGGGGAVGSQGGNRRQAYRNRDSVPPALGDRVARRWR